MRRSVTARGTGQHGSEANGAGSAVDETPRTAMVSLDWFGVTGAGGQGSCERMRPQSIDQRGRWCNGLKWLDGNRV
jgi:hypothetical protein